LYKYTYHKTYSDGAYSTVLFSVLYGFWFIANTKCGFNKKRWHKKEDFEYSKERANKLLTEEEKKLLLNKKENKSEVTVTDEDLKKREEKLTQKLKTRFNEAVVNERPYSPRNIKRALLLIVPFGVGLKGL